MVVRKEHLYAGLLIVAIAISFVIQRIDNRSREAAAREANIASCTREVTRDAYEAAGFIALSERVAGRGAPRDKESARRYEGIALSVADTFPTPGTAENPIDMIQVNLIQAPDGSVRFRLTDDAKKLIEEGCRQVF
jgi:hypothetical protein